MNRNGPVQSGTHDDESEIRRGRSRMRDEFRERSRGSRSRPVKPKSNEELVDEDERMKLEEKKRLMDRVKELEDDLQISRRKKLEELEFRYRQERIAIEATFGVRDDGERQTDPIVEGISATRAPSHHGTISQTVDLSGMTRKYEALPNFVPDDPNSKFNTFSAWKEAAELTLVANYLYVLRLRLWNILFQWIRLHLIVVLK